MLQELLEDRRIHARASNQGEVVGILHDHLGHPLRVRSVKRHNANLRPRPQVAIT